DEVGDLDLDIDVSPLDVRTIDAFMGAGLAGAYTGHLDATGPLNGLHVLGELAGSDDTDGVVRVDAVVDVGVPSWEGSVAVRGFRVDHLAPSVGSETRITGTYTLSGSGASWPDGLKLNGTFEGSDLYVSQTAIDHVRVGVALDDGVIVLTDLDAHAPSGTIEGGGIIDLRDGHLELTLNASDLLPDRLDQFNVPKELLGTRLASELTLSGELFEDPLRLVLSGQMVAEPFVWSESIRARRMRAWYEVRVLAGDDVVVQVTGEASASSMDVYGTTLRLVRSRNISVDVDDAGVKVGGDVYAEEVVYPLPVEGLDATLGRLAEVDDLAGNWTVDVPYDGELSVDVDLVVGPHSLLRYSGEKGSIKVIMVGSQLDIVSTLVVGPRRHLADVVTHLDLDTMRFSFDTLRFSPVPGQIWAIKPKSSFLLDGLGVKDADVQVLSSQGTLTLRGTVGLDGLLDASVRAEGLRMEALAELVPPWFEGLGGEVDASFILAGESSRPRISGAVQTDRLHMEDVFDEVNLDLRVAGEDRRLAITGAVEVLGESLATVDVELGVDMAFDKAGLLPNAPIRGTVVMTPGSLARVGELVPMVSTPTGEVSASMTLAGTMRRPRLDVGGVAELRLDGVGEEVRLEFGAVRRDEDFDVWADARRGMHLMATVRGGAKNGANEVLDWALAGAQEPDWSAHDLFVSDLNVDVVLIDTPLPMVVDAAQLPVALRGSAQGVVHVAGSGMRPQIDGHLSIVDGYLGAVAMTEADLIVQRAEDSGYNLEFFAAMQQAQAQSRGDRGEVALGDLSVQGHIPLELDFTKAVDDWVLGDLDLTILGDGVPLAVVAAYDPGVQNASGNLQLEGFVRGHPFRPEPTLSVRIDDGSLTYAPVKVRYERLFVDVEATPEALLVHKLCMYTSRGQDDGLLGASEGQLAQVGSLLSEGVGRRGLKRDVVAGACPLIQPSVDVRGGKATLKDFAVTSVTAEADLRQFLVSGTDEQHIEVSTRTPIVLTGDLSFPAVTGSLHVDRAEFVLDNVGAGGGASALDPRIEVHRAGQDTVSAETAETSILDDLDIVMQLDLGRNSRAKVNMPLEAVAWLGQGVSSLTKMDIEARLTGDLRVQMHPCRMRDEKGESVIDPARVGACGVFLPEVLGRTVIEEGSAAIFQSTFDLADSALSFVGNEVYNPNLELHGVMDAGGVEITMDITGTAYEPDPVFESKDTDQVFVTLMLGRPVEDIDNSSLLTMMAMAGFKSVLGNVNLGSVSIDPSGRISMGITVAPQLYVELRLASTSQQGENQVEGAVEWTAVKGVVAVVTAGDQVQAVEFLLERKY
ncbi:MAG: hypothetical protein ACI9MC_000190, partial [Kiritimatiellia bacterium]